ncbi:MAG: DUF1501 domain-containing protein [Gemmataceae bacterium]|nr:DUF1501 domain-containing protein [Gemmataceae bacterium]
MSQDLINGLYRRDFLRMSALGVGATSLSGWMSVLAANAAKSSTNQKSCILLWMDGGPSHKDTFDLKPESEGAGEFKPISTSAPGVQISEHFPKLAKWMHKAAVLRSMSTGEGAHGRAKYFLHTGYKEGQGGLTYPSLGAIASMEKGVPGFPIPNFITIGGNRSYGSGYLGSAHQPLVVADAARGVENLKPLVGENKFDGRVSLLQEMEKAFHKDYGSEAGAAHQTTYQRAVTMMKSSQAKAFDISQESAAVRSAYGSTKFGDGCLLARRLVETGVRFVEVVLGGWDTHQDNFERVKNLSTQVDSAMSALLKDLQERGLLDSTMVIWMGDFGRTPKINQRGPKPGRDHFPRAWSSVMAGGGIKGGQVIGKTDKNGASVEDRPVSTIDFMATACTGLGIDFTRSIQTPIGRPIRLVEKGANPLKELFS